MHQMDRDGVSPIILQHLLGERDGHHPVVVVHADDVSPDLVLGLGVEPAEDDLPPTDGCLSHLPVGDLRTTACPPVS